MSNESLEIDTKIFVGNVPFQCMQEEFKQCFKDVSGFISAEIVTRHNSPYSRGFGFITLKTKDDANKLVQRNDIMFKDRVLRFTEYNFQDKLKVLKQQKNYLFVRDVPVAMMREQLKKIFQTKGTVGTCFINTNIRTGESRGNAVVEIKEDNIFENLINEKTIQMDIPDSQNEKITKCILDISKWKNKIKVKPFNNNSDDDMPPQNNRINSKQIKQNKFNRVDSKEIYRLAFNAGVNAGRLEGLRIAKGNKTIDLEIY